MKKQKKIRSFDELGDLEKMIYRDCCPRCDQENAPARLEMIDLEQLENGKYHALYVCSCCRHVWKTWYSAGYPDFISKL